MCSKNVFYRPTKMKLSFHKKLLLYNYRPITIKMNLDIIQVLWILDCETDHG